MATASSELGTLCLVSTTAELELQLHSHALFTVTHSRFTIEELILAALNSPAASKPWTLLGDNFTLTISLSLDETDVEPDSLTQTFAQRLYDSEMWSLLRLEPTAMEVSNDSKVTIQISHSTDLDHLHAGRDHYHRLSEGPSRGELRPHSGAPVLELNNVQLTMRVIHRAELKRRKLNSDVEESHVFLKKGTTTTSHAICSEEFFAQEEVTRRANTSESIVRRVPSVESMLDVSDPGGEFRQHGKRSYSLVDHAPRRIPCSQQDVLDLIDAGMRHAITSKPTRPGKGIRLAGSESFKYLADIAPSIWSPGYLEAMSSRSLLLPTISHALSHVGVGNAKSSSLRPKVAEVARRSGCNTTLDIPPCALPDPQQLRTAQNSIESRLWRISQISLLDESAACHLKVLSPIADVETHQNQHEILDMESDAEADDGYDSDGSMMELQDAASDSDDDLLSICTSVRSLSLDVTGEDGCELLQPTARNCVNIAPPHSETDEEMLCI